MGKGLFALELERISKEQELFHQQFGLPESAPLKVGNVYHFSTADDLVIYFLVVRQHLDDENSYQVCPLTDCSLRRTPDIDFGDVPGHGHLVARCGSSFWAHESEITRLMPILDMQSWLSPIRQRLADLARGRLEHLEQSDGDFDSELDEHLAEMHDGISIVFDRHLRD
jgi:hypothetical protein